MKRLAATGNSNFFRALGGGGGGGGGLASSFSSIFSLNSLYLQQMVLHHSIQLIDMTQCYVDSCSSKAVALFMCALFWELTF